MSMEITSANFESEVLNSSVPVLIDFWASWCGPCRMLAPTIDKIAEEQEGKIKVGKINVDEQAVLAAQFGIASIPTLVVFSGGKAVATTVGVQSKESIESMLGL